MLLRLTHTTDLAYSDLISESAIELRMAPRQEDDQHRLSFTLAIGPTAPATSYFDWLGNTVHTFNVNSFHKQIRIIATSVVETNRPPVDLAGLPDRWPVRPDDYDYGVYDFLQFGGPIVDSPLLRQLATELRAEDSMPLGELADRMLRLINERFTYRKGITTAASPITDLLEKGSGVCQDFTHLMIGLSRAMGVPARYVSGMLHPNVTVDENGDVPTAEGNGHRAGAYRGYTQTHAWAELLFPSVGWIGFDPANNCAAGENFVKVGIGRHFFDVPPNKGTWRGKAKESIEVGVESQELEEIPQELAAERVQPLDVPLYSAGSAGRRDFANQQQEHQQQQERESDIHHQQSQQQQNKC